MAASEPQSYVSAFVPPSLRERLEESAREHDRSLSGELRVALRQYFADPSAVSPSPSDVLVAARSEESQR